MAEFIINKNKMYEYLKVGKFGNTTPYSTGIRQWQNYIDEIAFSDGIVSPLWGIRSPFTWDKRMRLDVPTAEVVEYCIRAYGFDNAQKVNISPMVDQWVLWRGEIWDFPTGWIMYGVSGMRNVKWREALLRYAVHTEGIICKTELRRLMNENSFDDLIELFDRYPEHIVEVSILDRCYGTVPHRNAVVWEVRQY